MDRRRLSIWLASVAVVVLALVPAVVVFSLGWLHLPDRALLPGQQAPAEGSPEAWTLFALFYLLWIVADVALLVFLYDRLGFKYMPQEQKTRESRRKKRRRVVGLGYMEARERAAADVSAAGPRKRRTARPAEPDPMEGRPPRLPPSERGHGVPRPASSPPEDGRESAQRRAEPTPGVAATPGPAPTAGEPAAAGKSPDPDHLEESA